MNLNDDVRPGLTIIHHGERLTIVRVFGETVMMRDESGKRRHLWIEQVDEALVAETSPPVRVDALSEVTIRACTSLGFSTEVLMSAHPRRRHEVVRDIDQCRRNVQHGDHLGDATRERSPWPNDATLATPGHNPPYAA